MYPSNSDGLYSWFVELRAQLTDKLSAMRNRWHTETQTLFLTTLWRTHCLSHLQSLVFPHAACPRGPHIDFLFLDKTLVKATWHYKSLLRPGHGRLIFSVHLANTRFITVVMLFLDLVLHACLHGWTYRHQSSGIRTLIIAMLQKLHTKDTAETCDTSKLQWLTVRRYLKQSIKQTTEKNKQKTQNTFVQQTQGIRGPESILRRIELVQWGYLSFQTHNGLWDVSRERQKPDQIQESV